MNVKALEVIAALLLIVTAITGVILVGAIAHRPHRPLAQDTQDTALICKAYRHWRTVSNDTSPGMERICQ